MRKHEIALAFSLFAAVANAQVPAHVVTGVAFDSIAGVALSGAVIQLVRVDSTAKDDQKSFSTIADSAGHFRLEGIPGGRFAIGYQHSALNAFGLESPIGGLELASDTSVTFNVALTAGSILGAHSCKDAQGAPEGILAGFVTDARRDVAITSADVTATWVEVGLDKGKLRSAPRRVSAAVSEDGSYKLCGVPPSAAIGLRVSHAGYRSIESELMIPDQGVARHDFRLVDSASVRGTSVIAGRVLDSEGKPVSGGQAAIRDLQLEVPIRDGAFAIADLAAGSWSVDVRAIGYEERTQVVEVADRATKSIVVRMDKKAQTLETVNVVGKAGRDVRVLGDIEERQRIGGGTAFLPGSDLMAHARLPADVMRFARGFSQKNEWRVEARPYVMGGRMAPCGTIPSDSVMAFSRTSTKPRVIAVYLDGIRYPAGLQSLNNDVMMDQILAIETFPDISAVPVQWRTNDACAVIAVWTRH